MNKLVSVIIPCYNAEEWLGAAIESVLAQSYAPIEIIVVDDGSTDNSIEVAKTYGDKICLVTQDNKGQSAARNKGFSLSKGEYIQWLDADDFITSEKIEVQAKILDETNVDIVYSDWRHQIHHQNGNVELGSVYHIGSHSDMIDTVLRINPLTIMCCLLRRQAIESIEGFDESLKAAEDTDFWLRASIDGAKFLYLPGCYSTYRIYGSTTVSHNKTGQLNHNLELVIERVIGKLGSVGMLNHYRFSVATRLFLVAKNYAKFRDKKSFLRQIELIEKIAPDFTPKGTSTYELIYKFLGKNCAYFLLSMKGAL